MSLNINVTENDLIDLIRKGLEKNIAVHVTKELSEITTEKINQYIEKLVEEVVRRTVAKVAMVASDPRTGQIQVQIKFEQTLVPQQVQR